MTLPGNVSIWRIDDAFRLKARFLFCPYSEEKKEILNYIISTRLGYERLRMYYSNWIYLWLVASR